MERELGSAKTGVGAWWFERVTAVALVPLTLWFTASLIARGDGDYAAFVGWMRTPYVTLLTSLLLISLFSHLALGLQVVVEDYVHSWAKVPALLTVRFTSVALCAAGLIATLRIAFGG